MTYVVSRTRTRPFVMATDYLRNDCFTYQCEAMEEYRRELELAESGDVVHLRAVVWPEVDNDG